MEKRLTLPLSENERTSLRAGDYVFLTGTIYTARDAAHKRMQECINAGEKLPFDVNGQTIYYMGPSPERPGQVIGSAGPTTASRMDKYAPTLLNLGLKGMIGKGKRCGCKESGIVFCSSRWRRRIDFQVYSVIRNDCI